MALLFLPLEELGGVHVEGLVLADVHNTASTLDMMVRTIERGVVERLRSYGVDFDNRIGGE